MLQIPLEQMVALDRASERAFVDRTASAVFADYPEWRGASTAEAAQAMVSQIVQLLMAHDITEETQHIDVVCAFARNDVAWPWPTDALAILKTPVRASARVSRLIADADLGTWQKVPVTLSTNVPALLPGMESRHA